MKRALVLWFATDFLLALLIYPISFYYHSLYNGQVDTTLPEYPDLAGFMQLLLNFLWFVALKYGLYQLLGYKLLREKRGRVMSFMFLAPLVISFSLDAWILFISSAPVTDAGFAGIGLITITPLVLFGGLIMLSVGYILEAHRGYEK